MNAPRLRRSPRALERRVAADVLLTTPSDPEIHELSGGAAAVWEELASARTLDELIGVLAAAHSVDGGEIGEQVARCVDELVGLRLLEVADA